MDRYGLGKVIYKCGQKGVEVLEAVERDTNRQVVLKILSVTNTEDANPILQECMLQRGLVHPGICIVNSVLLRQEPAALKVVVVLEKLERDLAADVKVRKNSNNYYSETEIFQFVEQNIAHRDIKPANVLISANGSYKVSDFGSATEIKSLNPSHTLVGTPLYLSPQLLDALSNAMRTGSSENVPYDPYKSDVYSLGLTILYMTKLGPSPELSVLQGLESKIENAIQGLGYSQDLKNLLRGMLQIQEQGRLNIEAVYENAYRFFQRQGSPQADSASELGNFTTVVCKPQEQYPAGCDPFSTGNGCIVSENSPGQQCGMNPSASQVYYNPPAAQAFSTPSANSDRMNPGTVFFSTPSTEYNPPQMPSKVLDPYSRDYQYSGPQQPPHYGDPTPQMSLQPINPYSREYQYSEPQRPGTCAQSSRKKAHDPKICIGCSKKIIDRQNSIPLSCSLEHRFCTGICLKRFIKTQTNYCPVCQAWFDQSNYQFD